MDSNTCNTDLKFSNDVINKIRDLPKYSTKYAGHTEFPFYTHLDEEQKALLDELIPNEELRERYKKHGLCDECNQVNTGGGLYFNETIGWCQSCNSKHCQQDFNKWTSGNQEIDKFIQNFQLNATCKEEVIEWIPYEKFERVKHLAEGGYGTVYSANWDDDDGRILGWDINQNEWRRDHLMVALKELNDSQNITADFLQEVCNLLFIDITLFKVGF